MTLLLIAAVEQRHEWVMRSSRHFLPPFLVPFYASMFSGASLIFPCFYFGRTHAVCSPLSSRLRPFFHLIYMVEDKTLVAPDTAVNVANVETVIQRIGEQGLSNFHISRRFGLSGQKISSLASSTFLS